MASLAAEPRLDAGRDRLVIGASSLGTLFEWYDFFVYGTLAPLIAQLFFPVENATAGFLLALATFGAGFGVRPIGAVLFGHLGDRLGRKYTFLVTITVMGLATAAVGLLPTYEQAGIAAPILLVSLRLLQGLALGGEYGGAAIYVAEHAPANRRGFYTSFIQASVVGGFLLSLVVVLGSGALFAPAEWTAWGWRTPFLFSLLLLAVSLWIRLKLKESPVFQAMKSAGTTARNPLRESFSSWPQIRGMLVALFGVTAGMTVIWYTAQFQALYFLQTTQRVDDTAARLIAGAASLINVCWFVLFGWLSDRVGRKKLMVIGYVLTLILIFPIFFVMARAANPALAEAMARAPVVVRGSDCAYNPFALKAQATECGRVLDALSKRGIAYRKEAGPPGPPAVTIGGRPVDAADAPALERALADAGYSLEKVVPRPGNMLVLVLTITAIGLLSGLTYGPLAATLVELFPARLRYTSLSIPYHISSGYFGGFLPLISQYIVAKTGDPFAGIWYMVAVVAVALIVCLLWLEETAGKELE